MTQREDATIRDIARRAGVGVGTVSRVLNDSPNVSPATRNQVLQAIRDLGYRPRAAAKVLRTRKTNEIGFITDEIASTPFAVETIRGAQDAAWAQGKILLLVNTNRNPAILSAAIETMLDRQVEGLIYAAMFHHPVTLPPTLSKVPAVLVDCYVEERSLPSVVPDEVTGGCLATEYLLQQGHRRIGLLNRIEPYPATVQRFEGYQQALAAYGVPFDPALVSCHPCEPFGGYEGARALMRLADPPTAFFCFNDRMAMGAYDALRELGCAIPHDISVIGFDNQEILAANLRPPLTTMALPHYAMGQWAVNYLVEHGSSASDLPPTQVKLPCPLIERASVGPGQRSAGRS